MVFLQCSLLSATSHSARLYSEYVAKGHALSLQREAIKRSVCRRKEQRLLFKKRKKKARSIHVILVQLNFE